MSSIGDRMKRNYEFPSRHYLTRRMPVIVRLDGRAFHSWTRGLDKPFDQDLIDAMTDAAAIVAEGMQGFKLAYLQSDEASFLLTDYDDLDTEAWFGYVQSKVETIAASSMTAEFNRIAARWYTGKCTALFDARAFNIPDAEIANYFLWRARDWARNSLNMYAGSFFSHKQLHGKSNQERHDMLHSIGKNWATDLTDQQKNGTWIMPLRAFSDVVPSFPTIDAVVLEALSSPDERQTRMDNRIGIPADWPNITVAPQSILDAAKKCGTLIASFDEFDVYQWDRDLFFCPAKTEEK